MTKVEWVEVEGHRVARLTSQSVSVSIDLDRGAHIFEFIDRACGTNILYQDPRGLAEHIVGGWYELFPNSGPACTVDGRLYPTHGDVKDARWEVMDESGPNESSVWIEVFVESKSNSLSLHRRMELEGPTFTVKERVDNFGQSLAHYVWGHHITLNAEFVTGSTIEVASEDIAAKAQFQTAASCVVPSRGAPLNRMPSVSGGFVDLTSFPAEPAAEMLFAKTLIEPRFAVHGKTQTLVVDWDGDAFPALWIWMENRGTSKAPFSSVTTGLALEPQSSHIPSLLSSRDAGSSSLLEPGMTASGWLRATLSQTSS